MSATATPPKQYESLTEAPPSSIVWASSGGDGSGKSHFALTCCPSKPAFVFGFDPWGMNRVAKDLRKDREIKIARYRFVEDRRQAKDDNAKRALEVWYTFREDYAYATKAGYNLIWDREDLMWEMRIFAAFGALVGGQQKDYGPISLEYTNLVQEASANGCNLAILRGLKSKWVSKYDAAKGKMVGHDTGELIPDGMRKIADLVDITLEHRFDAADKMFYVKIGKFPEMSERGQEYPMLDFQNMVSLAYPDADLERWQ